MNITPDIWAMMDDFEEALAIKFEDFDRMMRGEA